MSWYNKLSKKTDKHEWLEIVPENIWELKNTDLNILKTASEKSKFVFVLRKEKNNEHKVIKEFDDLEQAQKEAEKYGKR